MAATSAERFARLRAGGFVCAATRLTDCDIPRIGHRIGVGEDEMHAVMDVEASGGGFDKLKRPKMLFEPHLFWRYVPEPLRARAASLGLAYAAWKPGVYPTDSYPRLAQAMAIDETAALKSASWGMGQILGSNFKAAGYASPQEMVLAFCEMGEAEHLAAMVRFIVENRLDDELRRHDWAGFARGYNGEGYARHGYHTKLEAAYRKWQRIPDTKWSPGMGEPAPDPMAQMTSPLPTPPVVVPRTGPVFSPAPRSTGNIAAEKIDAIQPPPAPKPSLGARLAGWLSKPWF